MTRRAFVALAALLARVLGREPKPRWVRWRLPVPPLPREARLVPPAKVWLPETGDLVRLEYTWHELKPDGLYTVADAPHMRPPPTEEPR